MCVEVLKILLELQFEHGNGNLSFYYNFWQHRKKELDISCDSVDVSYRNMLNFHIDVLNSPLVTT